MMTVRPPPPPHTHSCSGVNVCGITAGSGRRRVLCWGETRDTAFVPEDLEPAGLSELAGVAEHRREL